MGTTALWHSLYSIKDKTIFVKLSEQKTSYKKKELRGISITKFLLPCYINAYVLQYENEVRIITYYFIKITIS